MNLFHKYLIPSCCFSPSPSKVFDEPDQNDSVHKFNPSQIDSLIATNASTLIAQGGYSSVYLVPSSMVALKVHESSDRLYRMFRRELQTLARTNHPNIVKLIGYNDDEEAATGVLVLEYVPNGTLHEMLHGPSPPTWSQRVSIAFQIATALDYLHEKCDIQIIHGDTKASNVLLDSNFNAKLCDFGFARLGFEDTVNRSDNTMVGSPGYLDPHYIRTGLVSKKSDVYSFGVLVLELVTGMEAFCFESGRFLTSTVGPKLKECVCEGNGRIVEEIVDVRLRGEYEWDQALVMVWMAEECTGGNPSMRPSMGEVLRIMRDKVVVDRCDKKKHGKMCKSK